MAERKLTEQEIQKYSRLLDDESIYHLPEELKHRLLSAGFVMTSGRGEVFIKEGTGNRDVYFVLKGIMRIWHMACGNEMTLAFGLPMSIAVCWHSYYADQTIPMNFETCTPADMLRVPYDVFKDLLESDLRYFRWWHDCALQQLYYWERKFTLIHGTAQERYETMVKVRPEIIANVPLKVIATYLGITPQYLSQLRQAIVRPDSSDQSSPTRNPS